MYLFVLLNSTIINPRSQKIFSHYLILKHNGTSNLQNTVLF